MIHSIEIPLLMQYSIIIVDAIDMSQVVLYENLHRNYGYTWSSETKACEVVCNFMHEQPFVYMTITCSNNVLGFYTWVLGNYIMCI